MGLRGLWVCWWSGGGGEAFWQLWVVAGEAEGSGGRLVLWVWGGT